MGYIIVNAAEYGSSLDVLRFCGRHDELAGTAQGYQVHVVREGFPVGRLDSTEVDTVQQARGGIIDLLHALQVYLQRLPQQREKRRGFCSSGPVDVLAVHFFIKPSFLHDGLELPGFA